MIGYIYKTTNLITNKFYIGKRQRATFDKYYYGSGKHFSKSLAKYGKENFSREVLEWCNSISELNERECYWIETLDARNPDIGYNIAEGGQGCRESGKLNSLFCFVHNADGFIRVLKSEKAYYLENGYTPGKGYGTNGLLGKHRSDETRKKLSEANRGKHNHAGKCNPCFGSKYSWINDGKSNRRLSLGESIPAGWKPGKLQKPRTPTEKFNRYMQVLKTDNHWKGDNNPSRKNTFHWYTDGNITIRGTQCPDGFYPRRIRGKWYNDGIRETIILDTKPIPSGFERGRLARDRKID